MMTHREQQGNGPVFEIEYDPATHVVQGVFDSEGMLIGLELMNIVPLTAEELAWELNALSDQVAEAGKEYVERELNAAGQLMVDRILRKEPTNSLAVATDAWVENTYTEIETRKYYVRAGLWPEGADPCDFSTWTRKPYLVVQLKAEYDRLKSLP